MKNLKYKIFSIVVSVFFAGVLQAQEAHPACDLAEKDAALLVNHVMNSEAYSPGLQSLVSELYASVGNKIPIYPFTEVNTNASRQFILYATVSSKESYSDNDESIHLLLPFLAIGKGENQYYSTIQVDFMLVNKSTGLLVSAFSTYSVLRDASVSKNTEADHQRIGIYFENGKGRTDNTLFTIRDMYRAAAIRVLEVIKGLDAGSCRLEKSTSILKQTSKLYNQLDGSVERIEISGNREDLREIYFPPELSSRIRCSSKGKCRIIFAAKPTKVMAQLVEEAYANAYQDSVEVNCQTSENNLNCEVIGSKDNLKTFNKRRFLKLLYGHS